LFSIARRKWCLIETANSALDGLLSRHPQNDNRKIARAPVQVKKGFQQ
jgi:hypothetical protein